MLIYDNVKHYCDVRNLSIYRLEAMCELGNGTIANWRTSVPRVSTLQRVADVLQVDINDLTAGDERVTNDNSHQ